MGDGSFEGEAATVPYDSSHLITTVIDEELEEVSMG
jgi:hypothetical protein